MAVHALEGPINFRIGQDTQSDPVRTARLLSGSWKGLIRILLTMHVFSSSTNVRLAHAPFFTKSRLLT